MNRNIYHILAAAVAAALSLASCSKEVPAEEILAEDPGTEVTEPQGWSVAIHASIGGDSKALSEDSGTHKLIASFETTDDIYVYNKRTNVVDANKLHPDRDGSSVILTGTLAGDYQDGDELALCYGLNLHKNTYDYYVWGGYCDSLDDVADCAEASITITAADASSKTLTTGNAAFENLQSIMKLSFTDGTSPVAVKELRISTANNLMVAELHPDGSKAYCAIDAWLKDTSALATTEPVYVAFRNESTDPDVYTFEVSDGSDMYVGTKSGNLSMGKYYALSAPITVTKVPKPTVTNNTDNSVLEPASYLDYMYKQEAGVPVITISGVGERYYIENVAVSNAPRYVTLNSAHLTGMAMPCLKNMYGDYVLTLQGDNVIIAGPGNAAIWSKGFTLSSWVAYNSGSVLFRGEGTLTITAQNDNPYPSYNQQYSKGIAFGLNGQVAAQYGYILTVTDVQDNGDGTSTWRYTVAPDPSPVDQTLTICDDTVENRYVPYWGLYADSYLKSEFVIPHSKIDVMNGASIKSMKFYLKEMDDISFTGNCRAFLKRVDNNPFSSAKTFSGTSSSTTVYEGTLSVVGNEMTITFTTPFPYTVGNLLVGIYQTTQGNCKTTTFYGETLSNASLSAQSGSSTTFTTGSRYNFLPKTTFTYGQ